MAPETAGLTRPAAPTLTRRDLIARLAALQASEPQDEFGPNFFRRKLAEMTARRVNAQVMTARPAGYELPAIAKRVA